MQLAGSSIYLMATRPNLSYPVSYISSIHDCSKGRTLDSSKKSATYVKGTLDFGILYGKHKEPQLCGYSDSDWAGSMDDRKSTSGMFSALVLEQLHGPTRSNMLFPFL
jgi:hypothetical protein